MQFKTIIVEDEKMAATLLKGYCSKIPEIDLVLVSESPSEVIEYCKQNVIDLILLDVELPEMTGLELVDFLPYMPYLILTTSKKEYAYDAFQLNAIDYLKKPFPFTKLNEAIQKAVRLHTVDNDTKTELEDIFVKTDGRMVRLTFNEINYIESIGDYVKIVLANSSIVVHSTMKNILEKLPITKFAQIHRSYTINITKVVDIQDNSVVINKNVLPISRGMKDGLMAKLNVL